MPRPGPGAARAPAAESRPPPGAWIALVTAVATLAGFAIGAARVQAIDGGALSIQPGPVRIAGVVTAVPHRANGQVDVRVETPQGRLMVEVPEPVADIDVGAAVSASGTLRAPSDFERAYLEHLGIAPDPLGANDRRVGSWSRRDHGRARRRAGPRAAGASGSARPRRPRRCCAASSSVRTTESTSGPATTSSARASPTYSRSRGQNVVLLAILAEAVLGLFGVDVRAG